MKNSLLILCWFFLLAGLYACSGEQVSGGKQTVTQSYSSATGASLRVNNVIGADDADGIDEPFQSLQYALDQLRPGDVLFIEHNEGMAYSSDAEVAQELDENGQLVRNLRGFILSNSGTEDAPIIIEGRGVNRPVIDQEGLSSVGNAVLGLYLDCVSHVIIRNLEIREVNEAGISSATDGSCETTNITIENNYIHSVSGEKYVAGIRMMGVNNLLIRDNIIQDIVSNQSLENKTMVRKQVAISNVVIEDNHFENIGSGVTFNAQGLGSNNDNDEEAIRDIQINNNVFKDTSLAISLVEHVSDVNTLNDVKTGQFVDIDIYGNVFQTNDTVLSATVDKSMHQSDDVCFFNNTIVSSQVEAISISALTGFEIFNNIFDATQGNILTTNAPVNTDLLNSLTYIDNNLFDNNISLGWLLDQDGSFETQFIDMASWQVQGSGLHMQLSNNPDILSIIDSDPLFVDELNNNFTLSELSPALASGRFGMNIGADFSFSEQLTSSCFQ